MISIAVCFFGRDGVAFATLRQREARVPFSPTPFGSAQDQPPGSSKRRETVRFGWGVQRLGTSMNARKFERVVIDVVEFRIRRVHHSDLGNPSSTIGFD